MMPTIIVIAELSYPCVLNARLLKMDWQTDSIMGCEVIKFMAHREGRVQNVYHVLALCPVKRRAKL